MTTIFRELNVGSGVNLVGLVLRSSKPLYLILVANLFDHTAFGLYTLLYALVEILSGFAIFGMEHALLNFISRYDGVDEAEEYRVLRSSIFLPILLSFLLAAPLWLVPGTCTALLSLEEDVTLALLLTGLMVPCLTLLKALLAATRGKREMRWQVIIYDMGEPLLLLAIVPLLFWLGATTHGLLSGHLLVLTLLLLPAGLVFDRMFSLRLLFSLTARPWFSRQALVYGLDMSLPQLGSKFIRRIDLFIVNHYLPLEVVGIYGVAAELAQFFAKIRASYTPIVVPVLSHQYREGDLQGVRFTAAYMAYFVTLISVPFFLVLLLHGELLLGLYGKDFVQGYEAMTLLCLSVVLTGLAGPAGEVLAVHGLPRLFAWYCLLQMILITLLGILFTPEFGLRGAALASSLALILSRLSLYIHSQHVTSVSPFSPPVRRLVGLSILILGLAWWLRSGPLVTASWNSVLPVTLGLLGAYSAALWSTTSSMLTSRQ
ncbi:MAG: hypothetical protein A2284_16375 [Deltaproteobacteria bacterium RIFOXYA12_FULL_61_11]|nr:MAG: hypothetical protein A2284_16375 [Deltaproteobacteria bacterium RIFOXYA12_FULL_61_11]